MEVQDPAVALLIRRVSSHVEAWARDAVARYREEIPDYATLDDAVLYGDVMALTIENMLALLANLERGELLTERQLADVRESAARRVHQGVALASVLHAYRIWGEVAWEAILGAAQPDQPEEAAAALHMATRVIRHVNTVSGAVADGYLDEALGVSHDREMVRRDLLEALIAGRADSEAARRHAEALRLELAESYVVVVALADGGGLDATGSPLMSGRSGMRRLADAMRTHLQPRTGSLLVGARSGELIAFHPASGRGDVLALKTRCAKLGTLEPGMGVGIGSFHPGPAGVAKSYAEAREAAEIAAEAEGAARPVAFEDILVDHLLRTGWRSGGVLAELMRPVAEYDAERGSDLVATLRAFYESGFNLTRSAATLSVHANTVVYRLRRIRELTGRDPHEPDDLLLLVLGLKSLESAGRYGA